MIIWNVNDLKDDEMLSMYFSNDSSIHGYEAFKYKLFELLKIIKNEELLEFVEDGIKNRKI